LSFKKIGVGSAKLTKLNVLTFSSFEYFNYSSASGRYLLDLHINDITYLFDYLRLHFYNPTQI